MQAEYLFSNLENNLPPLRLIKIHCLGFYADFWSLKASSEINFAYFNFTFCLRKTPEKRVVLRELANVN